MEEIKTLKKALRERRIKKKQLSGQITHTMGKMSMKQMKLKKGRLVSYKTKYLVPLNKKSITKILSSYFEDEEQAKKISEYLMKNRYRLERTNLRRTKR